MQVYIQAQSWPDSSLHRMHAAPEAEAWRFRDPHLAEGGVNCNISHKTISGGFPQQPMDC